MFVPWSLSVPAVVAVLLTIGSTATQRAPSLTIPLVVPPVNQQVAFSAGLSDGGSVGPFDQETTLIFSKTFANTGSAYNQSTGNSAHAGSVNLPSEWLLRLTLLFLSFISSILHVQVCSGLRCRASTSSASQLLIT